jgi:hypothetical protein
VFVELDRKAVITWTGFPVPKAFDSMSSQEALESFKQLVRSGAVLAPAVLTLESECLAHIVGSMVPPNLFLNTGHDTWGWTMACGSDKLIADMLTGQRPEISTAGLGLDRYVPIAYEAVQQRPPLPSGRSAHPLHAHH